MKNIRVSKDGRVLVESEETQKLIKAFEVLDSIVVLSQELGVEVEYEVFIDAYRGLEGLVANFVCDYKGVIRDRAFGVGQLDFAINKSVCRRGL